MKCYQCPNPAMYAYGDEEVPLCLHCWSIVQSHHQREIENLERQLNFLSDELHFIAGLPSMGPRYPERPKPIQISGVHLNNINVSNSVVGTINTGSINSLDQSITTLVQVGAKDLAGAIKAVTEAALNSKDLTENQKTEIVEILSALAMEGATPTAQRKKSVVELLLGRGNQILSAANDLTQILEKWWPVIVSSVSSGAA